ncbi:SHOCT domain-containing protein [Nocardia ignorata]|uniref:SHOCT domain-containing protein n=1 Tax=Nocardia ignorata TaxID=145285 RepID=UPI0036432F69
MHWYDHDVNSWGYAWMGLGMLLFWGMLIVGFTLALRYLFRMEGAQRPHPGPPGPEHVLAERFARGEIDAQEYTDRLGVLRSTPQR